MRRLRPACDVLVRANADDNVARIRHIDVAISSLVKDCGVKLRASLLSNPGAQDAGGNAPAQVAINPMLLPPNGPALWGANTPPAPAKRPAGPKSAPATKGNLDGDQNAEQPGPPKVALTAEGDQDADQDANQDADQNAEQPGSPKVAEGDQDGDQNVEQPTAPKGGTNVAQEPEQARPRQSTVRTG